MGKKLIITVGLPRSGKTTWARRQPHPIVNPDSIRLALHGQVFVAKAEPWVWATAYAMTEALFLAGHETVVVDATNTTPGRRQEWIERFPSVEIVFQVFDEAKEVCIERARRSGREDLVPVIERMAVQWVPPTPDEAAVPAPADAEVEPPVSSEEAALVRAGLLWFAGGDPAAREELEERLRASGMASDDLLLAGLQRLGRLLSGAADVEVSAGGRQPVNRDPSIPW